MKTNSWNRCKYVMSFLLEWKKKTYPVAKFGQALIVLAVGQWSLLSPSVFLSFFPTDSWVSQLNLSFGESSSVQDIITIVLVLFGMALILFDIIQASNKARNTARVLITGMQGTSIRFPNELLTWAEKSNSRELIKLNVSDNDEKSIEAQIDKYNSEIKVGLISQFILHDHCEKLYVGGLARVPWLVAYGASFRAVSAKVIYFDRFHRGGDWKLLNDENESISIAKYDMDALKPDPKGNVGLALGFSTAIQKSQLPEFISNHTLILSSNIQAERNLVKNQENLHLISGKVQGIIDHLSSIPGCKKVHLFLSLQSTLGLDIGKRFQEGTHKNWVIHNFNANLSEYDWAIELSKEGISRFHIK